MSHGCLKFCSRALTRKQPHLCLLLHFPKVEAIANMPAASPFPTPACSTHEHKSLCVPEQLQAERPSPVASGSGCNYAWPDPSSLGSSLSSRTASWCMSTRTHIGPPFPNHKLWSCRLLLNLHGSGATARWWRWCRIVTGIALAITTAIVRALGVHHCSGPDSSPANQR